MPDLRSCRFATGTSSRGTIPRTTILRHGRYGKSLSKFLTLTHTHSQQHPWKIYLLILTPLSTSPTTHKTINPQCQCRILPTQLFTVSRQTSTEALEVFHKNLHLELDPCSSLTFLRSFSPHKIHLLPRLTFTMTPAHVEGWCGGAVASGYSATTLESQIVPYYCGGGPVPHDEFCGKWREVVTLLAAHANLPRLELTIEMGECTWVYFEDMLPWDETPDLSMFRFMYDFYTDVVTTLCELRGLGGLVVQLSMFEQLKPWLEREALGREPPEPKLETRYARILWENLWKRPRWYSVVPRWHDGERRLEGSNYQPEC